MVSARTLTAEPVDVLPRPAFAKELAARLRAVSSATAAALVLVLVFAEAATLAVDLIDVVPATACVACVPVTAEPEVLTYSCFRTSGFCQNSGATSMITWYCWGLKGL